MQTQQQLVLSQGLCLPEGDLHKIHLVIQGISLICFWKILSTEGSVSSPWLGEGQSSQSLFTCNMCIFVSDLPLTENLVLRRLRKTQIPKVHYKMVVAIPCSTNEQQEIIIILSTLEIILSHLSPLLQTDCILYEPMGMVEEHLFWVFMIVNNQISSLFSVKRILASRLSFRDNCTKLH